MFSDMKKLWKATKYKNVLKTIPQWFYIKKKLLTLLFHEDIVINQRTLMFSKTYWFWNGFKVVWYTSIYIEASRGYEMPAEEHLWKIARWWHQHIQTTTDITTYRLNQPRGRFSSNYNKFNLTQKSYLPRFC